VEDKMPDTKEVSEFVKEFKKNQKELKKEMKARFKKMSGFLSFAFILLYGFMSYLGFKQHNLLTGGLFMFIGLSTLIGFIKEKKLKPMDLEEKYEHLEERVKNIEKLSIADIKSEEMKPDGIKPLGELNE
jgi:hypothetical protein